MDLGQLTLAIVAALVVASRLATARARAAGAFFGLVIACTAVLLGAGSWLAAVASAAVALVAWLLLVGVLDDVPVDRSSWVRSPQMAVKTLRRTVSVDGLALLAAALLLLVGPSLVTPLVLPFGGPGVGVASVWLVVIAAGASAVRDFATSPGLPESESVDDARAREERRQKERDHRRENRESQVRIWVRVIATVGTALVALVAAVVATVGHGPGWLTFEAPQLLLAIGLAGAGATIVVHRPWAAPSNRGRTRRPRPLVWILVGMSVGAVAAYMAIDRGWDSSPIEWRNFYLIAVAMLFAVAFVEHVWATLRLNDLTLERRHRVLVIVTGVLAAAAFLNVTTRQYGLGADTSIEAVSVVRAFALLVAFGMCAVAAMIVVATELGEWRLKTLQPPRVILTVNAVMYSALLMAAAIGAIFLVAIGTADPVAAVARITWLLALASAGNNLAHYSSESVRVDMVEWAASEGAKDGFLRNLRRHLIFQSALVLTIVLGAFSWTALDFFS
jgi:hypothetical protein